MGFWSVLVSLSFALAALPSLARADVNGGKVQVVIKIPNDFVDDVNSLIETDYRTPPSNDVRGRYFNRARCLCDKADKPQRFLAEVTWATNPTSAPSAVLPVYTGGMCTDSIQRPMSCKNLGEVNSALIDRIVRRYDRVGDLLGPTNTDCNLNVTQATYGLYSSATGNDLAEEDTESFGIDLRPPSAPETVTVAALENAIRLEWAQLAAPEDIEYFQALCSTQTGAAVHATPPHPAQFDSVSNVCGGTPEALQPVVIANPTGFPTAPGTVPTDLLKLDEAYVCSQVAGGTATSIDIKNLKNDVPYWVVLVAVDKYGNYTARYVPNSIMPQPVTDFWEYLNEEDSGIEGGFCLVESAFGSGGGGLYAPLRAWRDDLRGSSAGDWLVDRYYRWGAPVAAAARGSTAVRVVVAIALAPLVAVALAWHLLSLPGLVGVIAMVVLWRRRRRRLVAATLAAAVFAPALAAAQSVSPYWDETDSESVIRDEQPSWHLGVRIGPYWPSIDKRFDAPGPYERTFNQGKGMLPMFDVHRMLSTVYGQFGIGVSAGYFGRDAASYLPIDPATPDVRGRSYDNRTYFRLVPVELTAMYRLSQLDDQWSFPLVPYLRGGLGYYIWWMNRPDGETSKSCDAAGTHCDVGRGASLGWVAAGGLSIRAETIDTDAARSMRDSGIEHAGFFAEVSTASVDGFGNAKKLSVGDTTWFAGIDFEF